MDKRGLILDAVNKVVTTLVVAIVIWAAATLRSIEINLTKQESKLDRIAEVSGIKMDNLQLELGRQDCRIATLEKDCHKGKEDDRTARGFREP